MLHQHAPLGAVRVSCPVVFPCVGVYERTQCFPSLATRVVATDVQTLFVVIFLKNYGALLYSK